jgi:hypothetical protein
MNSIRELQKWFSRRCDGDWEHGHGIKIATIDNPGWALDISLRETNLEYHTLEIVKTDRSETDWYWCWTEDGFFKARGGAENLQDMISLFLNWARAQEGE